MTRILLRGGHVHTPGRTREPAPPRMCVEDGTVVWTGSDDASAHFEDNADRVVELAGRLVTPAFVDAHAHLAADRLRGRRGRPGAAPPAWARRSTWWPRPPATRPPRWCSASAGTTPPGPSSDPFTRAELDRATGGRRRLCSRASTCTRPSSPPRSSTPARTSSTPRGTTPTGCVARDAHHAARAGAVPAAADPRTARTRSCARCRRPRRRVSAWCTSSAPPHLPARGPHRRRPPCTGRSGRCPRWSATGASSAASRRARELGCAGAGRRPVHGRLASARGRRRCTRRTPTPRPRGHLYLDAEQVARPRRRLHRARHPGGLPRHRRPRGRRGGRRSPSAAAEVVGEAAVVAAPAPARARRDGLARRRCAPGRARGDREHAAGVRRLLGRPDRLYAQRLGERAGRRR